MTTDQTDQTALGCDIEAAARAMAAVDKDTCFEIVDSWNNASEQGRARATLLGEEPLQEHWDNCDLWRNRARSAVAAVYANVAERIGDQRTGYLDSQDLSSDWKTGWHAATNHHANRLRKGLSNDG